MYIRKAIMEDVKDMHAILNLYADQGLLLPRSLSELYDHLRDFFVAQGKDQGESIRGLCGLRLCWEDLAEVKSLAVVENQQGKGYGKQLVDACLDDARAFGIKKVFTLTYIPEFFKNFGFIEIDKASLPHKIWADCLNCPKFPDCDETALMVEL